MTQILLIFMINYCRESRCTNFPLLRVRNKEEVQKRPFQGSETLAAEKREDGETTIIAFLLNLKSLSRFHSRTDSQQQLTNSCKYLHHPSRHFTFIRSKN